MNSEHYPILINGELVNTDKVIKVINPSTEEVFASCSKATEKHLDEAVKAAQKAQKIWGESDIAIRQKLLNEIAEKISENSENLARLLTLEQGKPLDFARGEIEFAVMFCKYFASQKLKNKSLKEDASSIVELHRKPLGVVAAIAPWNFPLLIAVYKTAPALLAGNALILKPAPTTPLSTCMFGQIIREIIPKGLVNILTDENELGPMITSHPGINKISFTGCTETGKKVAESGGPSLKRLTLELGGNDAAIVLEDADPSKIAEDIFNSAMANTGQVCAAIKRLYVHHSVYEEMCSALKDQADKAIIGDGFKQGINFGPLQNKKQYEKVINLIKEAKEKGKVISGGEFSENPGFFIPITIIRDIEDGISLVDEEQFGPVLPIIKYSELEEVIEKANGSSYGLGGSVWGEDIDFATQIAKRLQAGSVWVNQHAAIGPDIPLSGAKESGIGVEWGEEGLNEFSQIQVVNVKK